MSYGKSFIFNRKNPSFYSSFSDCAGLYFIDNVALLLEYYVAPLGFKSVDFYRAGGVKVSLDDNTKVVEEAGRTIYPPSKLPHGLKLTAIYFKDGPFIAIFFYSTEGNKDYKTAELTIEVAPSNSSIAVTRTIEVFKR